MTSRNDVLARIHDLTDAQKALLPTDADVSRYRETGWYKSGKLFTDDEIADAVESSDRFYAGEWSDPFSAKDRLAAVRDGNFLPEPGTDHGVRLRKHDFASLLVPGLAALVRHPLIGAVAARLAGDDVRLWHDQLLWKPVQEDGMKANVGWHTDRGYWKTCSSTDLLTAWIPFHDCDAAMGTITMVDGSLHWPDNTADLNFFSSDLDGLESKFNTGASRWLKYPSNCSKAKCRFTIA